MCTGPGSHDRCARWELRKGADEVTCVSVDVQVRCFGVCNGREGHLVGSVRHLQAPLRILLGVSYIDRTRHDVSCEGSWPGSAASSL